MIVGIYRSRRNFGMFVPIEHGGVTYYAKVYRKFVKGIGRYGPLVAGLSWETDRGYLVTVEADRYIDLPHDMLSRLEVLYYRLYMSCDGTPHVHLIAGPPMPKHRALKYARPYTDKRHIRLRHRVIFAGVVRVTPLPCEETLAVVKDPLIDKVASLVP
jgi:hypothetical protein